MNGDWIFVADALPEEGVNVLTIDTNGIIVVAHYWEPDTWIQTFWKSKFDLNFYCPDGKVIAWMPLPNRPKIKKDPEP